MDVSAQMCRRGGGHPVHRPAGVGFWNFLWGAGGRGGPTVGGVSLDEPALGSNTCRPDGIPSVVWRKSQRLWRPQAARPCVIPSQQALHTSPGCEMGREGSSGRLLEKVSNKCFPLPSPPGSGTFLVSPSAGKPPAEPLTAHLSPPSCSGSSNLVSTWRDLADCTLP